jgi:alpha-beta hydrolase superfamily lysophospholipase
MNRGFHAPEFFNDCSVDFETAIEFLVTKGCEEIVIIGHSLGGAKCAYYAGEVGHPRLRGVVLLSAIPSSYNFEGKEKEDLIARARQLIIDGQEHTILSCQEGKTVSLHEPATLIKSFEQGYRGTTLEATSKITLPILSLAAEREWNWFQVVTKGIQAVATKAASVDAEIIQGAKDHGYSGYEEQFARRVCSWVTGKITT